MLDYADLYKRDFNTVYKLCLAHFRRPDFALDITQDAFVQAYIKFSQLRDQTKFLPWVSTIAMNLGRTAIVNERERYNELPKFEGSEMAWEAFYTDDAEEIMGANNIRRWILTLPWEDQEILLLKYYYSMSDAEIAEVMEKPIGTVKIRLHRCKHLLYESIKAEEEGRAPGPNRSNNR